MAAFEVQWCQYQSSRSIAGVLYTDGDSFDAGAYGTVFWSRLATALGRTIIDGGQGGSTATGMRDRCLSRAYLRSRKACLWDGSPNGIVSASGQFAILKPIFDQFGPANVLWMPSLALPGADASAVAMLAELRSLVLAYGVNSPDAQAALVAMNDPVADAAYTAIGVVGASLTEDNVHLKSAPMDTCVSLAASTGPASGW